MTLNERLSGATTALIFILLAGVSQLASAQTSSGLLLGLGGLSGAAILGTAPWRKLSIRRKKVVS